MRPIPSLRRTAMCAPWTTDRARRSRRRRLGTKPPDKRELTEADFADVDFEALDYNSDYARFTAPGVPEAIKNKALQKLWASHAVFTTPDPFQDYLGDYTDAAVAVPPGTLKTAYRIGKGFLTDEEVAEWEKLGHPAETEPVAAGAAGAAGGRRCGCARVDCGGARRPARGARAAAPVGRLSRRPLSGREQPPGRRGGAGRAQCALPGGAARRRGRGLRRAGGGRRRRGRAQAHVRRSPRRAASRSAAASSRRWRPRARPRACASSAWRPACASPSRSPSTAATATRSAGRLGGISATR